MSKASIRRRITFVGDRYQAGTYVLRISVSKPISIAFGRFKQGKVIAVVPGHYSYVGSALSERGSASLARRLVRHATRSGRRHPHPIRKVMLRDFAAAGLGEGDLLPVSGKRLRWNVDHLLDQRGVELVAAIVIRSPCRIEQKLGQLIEDDDATVVIEKRLGANDIPGNTHLLRVEADEGWWKGLPHRIRLLLRSSSC